MALRDALRSITPLRWVVRAVKFRARLATETLRDARLGDRSPSGLPVPPARLRHRVHGTLDRESFLRVGATVAADIRSLFASSGVDLYACHRVLDFGSGSARVLANFLDAPSSCQLHGTDIDEALVSWCRSQISRVTWTRNNATPPLAYPDGYFDAIYSVSVFTHLDESYQRAWLAELARVSAPGATLVLTVHGESVIATLPEAERGRALREGFCYVTGARGWLKVDGLPDFYQDAYHTEAYVRRVWSEYFELIAYRAQAINGHQDAVILRRR